MSASERTKTWQGMNWCRKSTRYAIYLRDGFACVYCGQTAEDSRLSLDHLLPHHHGGGNEPTNLVTACSHCNSSRQDRTLEVWAEAVANYRNGDTTAQAVVEKVRAHVERPLDRKVARELIARQK